jgi:beta-galactosidase
MTGGSPRVSKDGDWTETYACNLIDWHLKEQETMPWLTGTAYWPFKDFSTPIRPENPVPYVNQKGIVERDLTPKESFYVFKSYWTEEPMVRIYGHSWPVRWGKEDEPKMVKVYSNCEAAELFLNGTSLGRRERNSQDYPAAGLRWVTPFRTGQNELRAMGYRNGQKVEDTLTFAYQSEAWGKPARLQLKLISETDQQDTVQVYALDANGIRCLDATNEVEFSLTGDGELIADLGTSTAARKVQLYNGRAQISLNKNNGPSMVSVKSKGLPTVFVEING